MKQPGQQAGNRNTAKNTVRFAGRDGRGCTPRSDTEGGARGAPRPPEQLGSREPRTRRARLRSPGCTPSPWQGLNPQPLPTPHPRWGTDRAPPASPPPQLPPTGHAGSLLSLPSTGSGGSHWAELTAALPSPSDGHPVKTPPGSPHPRPHAAH